MKQPKEIIDNSENNKLVSAINCFLQDDSNKHLDIASAYFNIQAFGMIKNNIKGIKKFRLLLGKDPQENLFGNEVKKTLGQLLLDVVSNEIENLDLTTENKDLTDVFIDFLKKDTVEVKVFDDFLHGKAYIFDNQIIIGSSNFTAAGLTRYGELNNWQQESQAQHTRKEWFEKFWGQSRDFKAELITILENSRFGTREYTPYEIYMKTLYELNKNTLLKNKGVFENESTKVDLTEFQEDAVYRVWEQLEKYNGCIVADSVGLGKTWIAKKIIEKIGHYDRKKVLVICPAQLKKMWEFELKSIDVSQNVISQEDIASDNYIEKTQTALINSFDNIGLIIVDESHNFRNPFSNRWENLFTLINDNISKKSNPKILFLTATPINNTPWDLYWQIKLLIKNNDSAFIKDNIPNLFDLFKVAKDNPKILLDLLNEISIRRTRNYIINKYPDAYLTKKSETGEIIKEKIVFPERKLENINYKLNQSYKGMYAEISDIITNELKLAYYKIFDYKIRKLNTLDETLAKGRMEALGGIFRTILLKRLESSIEAFRLSISNHILFLNKLKVHLNDGQLLTKKAFCKYILYNDEELDVSYKEQLESFKKEDYNFDFLMSDIDADIENLELIKGKIKSIKPEDDAKLVLLKERLLELAKDNQVVLFTYYADTLNYIHKEIIGDSRFKKLNVEAISSSGNTHKNPNQREKIIQDFKDKKINILLSTDVLSEGQNLQTAKYLINYDLHWNPTRMIQRAGRIDRIGSPYKKIYIYNFFPEDELESLLKLVQILQTKIIQIDASVGLDQSVLGEEIHPKVFGIIRQIKNKDNSVLNDLEDDLFFGGDLFFEPLKDYIQNKTTAELEKIPCGVYSGLKRNIDGVFLYYKYGEDSNYWYLYDIKNQKWMTNKGEIIDYIKCKSSEKRIVPKEPFEILETINTQVVEDIESKYREIEQIYQQDSNLKQLSRTKNTMFIKKKLIDPIEKIVFSTIADKQEDNDIIEKWDIIKGKLVQVPLTKKRISELRKISQNIDSRNWKKKVNQLLEFTKGKEINKNYLEPFDRTKLKLITIDFIC